MDSPTVPLDARWQRDRVVAEELALAQITYEKVLQPPRRPRVEPPEASQFAEATENLYSWAEQRGISAPDLLNRLVQNTGLPVLPLSTAQPTAAARALTQRILSRVKAELNQPLPWLPVDVVGPFLVVGHFCPYSRNFGGIPEDLVIKVILARGDYDRGLHLPEMGEVFRTECLRETPLVSGRPATRDEWFERILDAGCHLDADNLDGEQRADALKRLAADPAISQAVDQRLAGIRVLPTAAMMPSLQAFETIPRKLAVGLPALCYYVSGETRHVLLADQSKEGSLQDELAQSGAGFVTVIASQAEETEIRRLIDLLSGRDFLELQGKSETSFFEKDRVLEVDPGELAELTTEKVTAMLDDEEQSLKVVGFFLLRTIVQRSSDLHFDPIDGGYLLRNRVNGRCVEMCELRGDACVRLIAAIKGRANLDQQLRRKPQDGKFLFIAGGASVEVRVSTMPVKGQESLVLRLLTRGTHRMTLDTLGMTESMRMVLMEGITAPNGIIVIAGETGSGKTTTLGAIMHHLNRPDITILTMEDPVEMVGDRMKQIEIRKEMGLTFGVVFRSALRQDPDIIMLGEVRDEESAAKALEAANTGHLVFCTMHTNDAPSIVHRFRKLGISSDQVSDNLILGQAQTLIRTVCACARRRSVTTQDVALFRQAEIEPPAYVMQAVGCPHCGGTGYNGRRVVMELMPNTPELADLIYRDASKREIRECARAYGYRSIFSEAMAMAAACITTVEEARQERMPYQDMKRIL